MEKKKKNQHSVCWSKGNQGLLTLSPYTEKKKTLRPQASVIHSKMLIYHWHNERLPADRRLDI